MVDKNSHWSVEQAVSYLKNESKRHVVFNRIARKILAHTIAMHVNKMLGNQPL